MMNTKSAIVASALLLVACSCSKRSGDVNAASRPPEASNAKSAFDQQENKADLAVTQQIRKALLDDDALSVMAKNVTVVTQNGLVTLGGTVATADEKSRIGDKAEEIAGPGRVENRINVQPR